MRFKLDISIDNEAFQPDPVPEIARILRALAATIEQQRGGETFGPIRDINGNRIGEYERDLAD